MVASLTYRTNDITRWGGGLGSDLSATQVDINFWTLFSAIEALEDHAGVNAGIDYINQPSGGNLFFIHLTNHAVLGPFVIPTSQWNPRGAWAPLTVYAAFDLVYQGGSLYLITIPHTSAATFSALATDGMGHNLYNLVLQQPAAALPAGGVPRQKLVKNSVTDFDTAWEDDRLRLTLYVEGQPLPGELLMQYSVADHMTIPAGFTGSFINNGTTATANATYTLNKNGNPIGTITFNGSTITKTLAADAVFVPSDVITFVAPAVPDATHANISFTFVALLT